MPEASSNGLDILGILHTVSCYLFPALAAIVVLMVFFYVLSEARTRRSRAHSLPGFGTVGELIVLSGNRGLEAGTWFPVPREGVLGSVRSCDLVVPCSGVRSKHLSFLWEDGLGLLIHPHTGCEAFVNGVPVTCRTDASSVPMVHGSVLQVGSALLRLHLFAALDHTAAPAQQLPDTCPVPFPAALGIPEKEIFPAPEAFPLQPVPPVPPVEEVSGRTSELPPEDPQLPSGRDESATRRSDRWKEDFGE